MYIDGSKMRFCYAKFEKYLPPYSISGLSANETDVRFNVTKNTDSGSGGIIIAAYYSSDGILLDFVTEEISEDDTSEIGTAAPHTFSRGVQNGEKVKVFIWDSGKSMKPLSNFIEN